LKVASLILATACALVLSSCQRPSHDQELHPGNDGVVPSAEASSDPVALLAIAKKAAAASPNPGDTFAMFLKAAEAGSAEASYEVAVRLRAGTGVRKDFRASEEWMNKAAKAGSISARYKLVQPIFFTDPDTPDEVILLNAPLELVSELTALSELGVADAAIDLALLQYSGYSEGRGKQTVVVVPKDRSRALESLTALAEERNNARAQRELSERLEPGARADSIWAKLERQAEPHDLYRTGLMFDERSEKYYKRPNRVRGRPLNFNETNLEAHRWYERAALLGDADAMLALAIMREEGRGKVADAAEAFMWRRKAADVGSMSGQVAVGKAFYQGTGVVKDWTQAFDWFMRAATHPTASASEMAEAQVLVGLFYANGVAVERDLPVAYAWLNIAAATGDKGAIEQRGKLEARMTSGDLAEGQRLSGHWKLGERVIHFQAESSSASGSPAARVASRGTGFFVNSAGDVLTNNHVVDGCLEIRLPALSTTAKLVVADKANDLAVVRTIATAQNIPAMADPAALKAGQDVVVFGYPLEGYLPTTGNVTTGLISALAGPSNNSSLIQITAPVQPGNSGGPVLDRKGNIVGIVIGKADAIRVAKATGDIPQNVNFAISIGTLRGFLDANQIPFATPAWWSWSKDAADIAASARGYTVKVECAK
jgi:TPR repeat protein